MKDEIDKAALDRMRLIRRCVAVIVFAVTWISIGCVVYFMLQSVKAGGE